MEWLKEVCKYHIEWVKIMQSFGAKEFSEDYVQDLYIRLAEKSNKKKAFQNGKLNKSYIFFLLRNIYIDNIRKQRNNNEKSYMKHKHFNSYNFKKEENFFLDPGCYEDKEILKKNKYDIILNKILKEIATWHWYDVMLFNIYMNSGKSIRILEKESGISYFSIFHTLKNCKDRLRVAIGEDWEDFINKDYEFIKL